MFRNRGSLSKIVNVTIGWCAVIALVLMFVSSGESIVSFLVGTPLETVLYALSWPNAIVFNLSIGFLISVFFWGLVVYFPNISRRRLLRETLAMRYREFRQEIVQIFIWASGESESVSVVDELASDHLKFKDYFGSGSNRWYAVLNGIQGSELRMHELVLAMKMFSREVSYVLNNVAIDDPSIHRVLKRLDENILRLSESEYDLYDRVKHVGNFLWSMLARWNIIDGQLDEDVVQKMILKI